jgi:hypothetical protein
MMYSKYPCASLCFGTFLAGLSILKARTTLTPDGASPALYILNVAMASYGKGDPMTLLQNLLVHKGLKRLIGNKIRSDRGIYQHLSANNGLGLFILDEVAPMLKAIQKEDATTHHAYIAEAILQLFSAGATKGITFGKVASSSQTKGEPEIVIDNPMVAILGFTVTKEFNRMFNEDSLAKGLFQRFIPIVEDPKYVPPNETADKTAIIESSLFDVSQDAQELDLEGNAVESIQAPIRTRMRYTDEAKAAMYDLTVHYRKLLINTESDSETSEMAPLYGRIAEQIERVATVLAKDEITLEVLNYAKEFIESRHRATLSIVGTTMMGGKGAEMMRQEESIISAVTRLCQKTGKGIITKREVYQSVRRQFKGPQDFNIALQSAEERGKLKLVKNFKKKEGNVATLGIALQDVLEN